MVLKHYFQTLLKSMLKIYFCGLVVLFYAIVVNILIKNFGIVTWYDFGSLFLVSGFQSLTQINFFSVCWLFFVYPFTLGFSYFLAEKLYSLF